jgi:predicted dehydrogenase
VPSPLRVALLGYGLAGAVFHAPLIAAVDGLELAAIVTGDPERRARAERDHPQAALLDSADEVWNRADALELVVVATPNSSHVSLAEAAIDAGLAVVVDKPLAASAADGRALLRAARDRGVMLTVFQNRRWDGDFLTVRELLGSEGAGGLGEVLRFESRYERWRPQLTGGWRESDDPAAAGGLLYDLGSHLVDQALVLFGPAATVYAELDRRRPGAETDDDTFVALMHISGVHSHLWMSVLAAQPGPRFRLLGRDAAYIKYGLDVQEEALHAGRWPDDPSWGQEPEERWGLLGSAADVRAVPTRPGAYHRLYEGVVATLREGKPPPVDPDEVISALEVLEAAKASASEGRVIGL